MNMPLPSIPSIPLSWKDAKPFLELLGNNPIPSSSWKSAFQLEFIGPGPAIVHLKVLSNYSITPIWNICGTIPGQELDRYVMFGYYIILDIYRWLII
jgi:N-acetylated-alpha-linked acidic dipeptidase